MPAVTEADRRRTLMAQRLTRWRWMRRAVIGGVLLLGLTVVLSHAGLLGRGTDDWSQLDRRPVHVIRVLNGDTLLVRSPLGEELPVRLVGVAAPEEGSYGSAEARQALSSRAEGKDVLLRLEPTQTRDAGGAVLALVYPADADDLNIDLIREGYAYAERRHSCSMQPQFEQAESEARQRKRGLWRGMTDEWMPGWRREWLEAQREKKRDRLARPATQPARQ
jgi:micrococcal nuclease